MSEITTIPSSTIALAARVRDERSLIAGEDIVDSIAPPLRTRTRPVAQIRVAGSARTSAATRTP
jgi:hypothetical protein